MSYFKNLDIPGPEPNFLFGNILELYYKEPIKCFDEWLRKYGRVFGFFYGMNPVLLVADPELLKTIFIKDFPKFMDREPVHPTFEYTPEDKDAQTVLILPGKKWKEIRSVLTPTFTAAKLKQMAGSMNASIDTMMSILQERAKKGQDFDVFDTYQRVTMDIIARTAFGIRTEVQTDLQSRILRATKLLFSTPYRDPIIFVGLCFPSLRYILRQLLWVILAALNKGEKPMAMLRKRLMEVLNYRKENPQGAKKDLLQLMIDTKIYSHEKEVDTKHLEMGNAESEAKFTDQDESNKAYRKMTDDEIVSSSFTVLLAGYETTSTALTFTTYLLAKYPDVQEKLYEEVRDLIQSGQTLEYATINQLQYLDKVFCESMRVYPPVYS